MAESLPKPAPIAAMSTAAATRRTPAAPTSRSRTTCVLSAHRALAPAAVLGGDLPGAAPTELRTPVHRPIRPFGQQQDRLLNMRLSEDIDQETFARKHTELRDRLASIKLQLDVVDRCHDETAELALKVFELSQTLRNQWLTADYAAKRRILEIVFLNCSLDDVTLVPTMRKPFDVLTEGLISENSRGNWHSFEPLVTAFVEAVLTPNAESVVATRVVKLSA